jgi:hypothetical protein
VKKFYLITSMLLLGAFVTYCGSTSGTNNTCSQAANTSASGTTTTAISGSCSLLTRDVSSCKASREAAGLGGTNWMNFSCRVTLSLSGGNVTIVTDSQPDYSSTYFSTTSACYTKQTTTYPDPNTLSAQSLSLTVPFAPSSTSGATMSMGIVGVALNGVGIFSPVAAGSDNIFDEIGSFDYCQGHPQNTGLYHYHSEPYAISSNDSKLIGVARDGYFIYGRNDSNGTLATGAGNGTWLTSYGGHVGVPPTGGASIFHYHAHLKTGTNTAGSTVNAYFLLGNATTSSANYYGTAGACTGC